MRNNGGFGSIGVAGLGLIGGSLAKAFHGLGIKTYGFDGDVSAVKACGLSGVFEGVTDEFGIFAGFPLDLVYICLPVNASLQFIKTLGEAGLKIPVTDGASTKASIMAAAEKAGLDFCGGHPLRGKETSGFKNSEANLFKGARHILTPGKNAALAGRLKELHEAIGMKASFMEAGEHDKVLAAVSHLPHIAAFCLMDMVESSIPEAFEFIGGGFRDFTRIAASDPLMWADIFTDNASALLESVDKFRMTVEKWRSLVEAGDHAALKENILKVSDLRRTL